MTSSVIDATSAINKYASHLSILFSLMQDNEELDRRIIKNQDIVIYILAQSQSFMYARPKSLAPLLKHPYTIFETDLGNLRNADRSRITAQLKSFPEYIRQIKWHNQDKDIAFKEYLKYKNEKQML